MSHLRVVFVFGAYMSEVAEVPEVVEPIENDDDFNAGFSGTDEPTETPAPVEETTAEESVEPEQANAEPEPEPVVLTKVEYERLLAQAERVDAKADKAEIDRVFGKVGELNRVIQSLQSQIPQGVSVELDDDDFKELREEYGDMAEQTLKGLKRVFSKVTGTASAPSVQIDQGAIESAAVERAKRAIAIETLDETHEGWRDVVGLPNEHNEIPQTDFRKWLATKPEAYQQRVGSAFNPVTIGRAIDAFREDQKKAKAQADSRQKRLSAAVTPRGTGGHATSTSSADDDFEAGFKSG